MSRIGKQPVIIPANTQVAVNSGVITVTGPKGTLEMSLPDKIKVDVKDGEVIITRVTEEKKVKSNHGTIRARIQNMVTGVNEHWQKELEIRGTGYKASTTGTKLTLIVGFIHPVVIDAPVGITFQVPEETKIIVSGPDKVVVGQVASNIHKIRKPEPYKGKGIRYLNEFIKLKAGKTAKA